ncbi:MAG: hypothetical protein Q4E22_03265 [Coriobacteriia bacterium]|nr:hypothetical protein [Coriobacteriia bacterium]
MYIPLPEKSILPDNVTGIYNNISDVIGNLEQLYHAIALDAEIYLNGELIYSKDKELSVNPLDIKFSTKFEKTGGIF